VFGSSAGAFIGLDLVARHPAQVRLLIAHEPPVWQLLPDAEQFLISAKILETYRHEGEKVALRQFAACAGIVAGEWEPDVTPPQRSPLAAGNPEFFLTKEASEIERYVFDLPALKVASTRIVPAGGNESRGYFTFRCAAALSNVLGTSVAEFPGHHAGYRNMPKAFAQRLREILDA
jgi:pimeloyl-ACP methyl ester carboxylesterase